MKNMKFGFPMADEKREIEIKETRLKKRGLLMECKEMESLNTRKLNDVLSLRKFRPGMLQEIRITETKRSIGWIGANVKQSSITGGVSNCQKCSVVSAPNDPMRYLRL